MIKDNDLNYTERLEVLGMEFIKQKDGKDRLTEALCKVVEQDYYKLGYVTYFYNLIKFIFHALLLNIPAVSILAPYS